MSDTNNPNSSTTHFGFEQVTVEEKVKRVGNVFHSVAAKYDIMNDALSFGIHRAWKALTIQMSGVRSGHNVLDIAGGTGDLTMAFSKLVGDTGHVILADINDSMLDVGKSKLIDKGYWKNISLAQCNAEHLPFADNSFDCITIAFGLRNVTDKAAALRSMHRVLKPGGRLLVLEFSKPKLKPLSKFYDFYSFNIMPKIGKFIADDEDSYRYLAESIRMHPDQETLKYMMEEAGFAKAEFHNMTGGIVALHRGFKA